MNSDIKAKEIFGGGIFSTTEEKGKGGAKNGTTIETGKGGAKNGTFCEVFTERPFWPFGDLFCLKHY